MEVKFEFNRETCLYKSICEGYKTIEEDPTLCSSSCLRYLEMFYLLSNSRIPKKQCRIHRLKPEQGDLESFIKLKQIQLNILNFVSGGNSLYLYSKNCGNGKTSWTFKLMQSYFDKVWYGNRYKTRGIFIHTPMFMVKLRENISNKSEDIAELLKLISTVDLVVWDDIASSGLKEFDFLNLSSYIDERIQNGLCNIYTGNLDEEFLKKELGERLFSRIWSNSKRIKLVGDDRREFRG